MRHSVPSHFKRSLTRIAPLHMSLSSLLPHIPHQSVVYHSVHTNVGIDNHLIMWDSNTRFGLMRWAIRGWRKMQQEKNEKIQLPLTPLSMGLFTRPHYIYIYIYIYMYVCICKFSFEINHFINPIQPQRTQNVLTLSSKNFNKDICTNAVPPSQ